MSIKSIFFLLLIVYTSLSSASAQKITQNINGRVVNEYTGDGIANANVYLENTDPRLGASTNTNGLFSIKDVPVGRYSLSVKHLGYSPKTFHNIMIISAKESNLTISLVPNTDSLMTVTISGNYEPSATLDVYSFTTEEINRFAATYFDPARLSVSLAGVSTVNDQSNHVSVHGNSPNNNSWYLNGLPIVNPNHLTGAGTFSDQPTTSGGSVNILNAQVLSKSNFYKNVYPVNFNDAMGGVFDMYFRNGDTDNHHFTIQAGAIGLEVGAEGPFDNDETGSYLVNYRYSTVGLLTAAGIDFGNEEINYTDLSFNLNFSSKENHNQLNVFGLAGTSKNNLDFLEDGEEIESDKDLSKIIYDDLNYALGSTYQKQLKKSVLNFGLLGYYQNSDRNSKMKIDTNAILSIQDFHREVVGISNLISITKYFKNKHKLLIGNTFQLNSSEVYYLENKINSLNNNVLIDGINSELKNSTYVDLQLVLTSKIKFNAGFQVNLINVTHSDLKFINTSGIKSSTDHLLLNPSAKLVYQLNTKQSVKLSYQLSGQTQNVSTLYALPSQMPFGFSVNKELKPIRAHNLNFFYINALSRNLNIKTQVYYQHLFNVPIVNNSNRVFSLLNNHEQIIRDTLANEGTGENYGIDISVQKEFSDNYYLLLNSSVYKSTFTDANDKTYSTNFDGRYLFNVTSGYEKARKKNPNSFININTKVIYQGGYRYTPIDILESEKAKRTIFIESKTNSLQHADYFRLDAGIRFIKNKSKYTRTWSIDIQNITNNNNVAYKYYDTYLKRVKTKYHLSIVPIFNYKIEF